jgi:hypothetical protein
MPANGVLQLTVGAAEALTIVTHVVSCYVSELPYPQGHLVVCIVHQPKAVVFQYLYKL